MTFATHSRLVGECKSQSRKRLRKVFQNLGLRVFGNSLGDSFVSHLSCEKRVFCKNRVKIGQFSKLFTFPRFMCLSLCLLHLSLSQNLFFFFHSKNFQYSLQSSLQIQENVWVFTPFYFISNLKHSISWICWFLDRKSVV